MKNVVLLPFGVNKNNNYIDKSNINLIHKIMYGQLEHPEDFVIDLNKASHLIENINSDYSCLYGDIKILDTHYGRILKRLVEENLIVFRPRMRIEEDGSCTIYTFDAITMDKDIYYDINYQRFKKIKKIIARNI